MRWTPISQTTVGMILGEPVLDSRGRVLAKKGEKLSDELLALLQASGVKHLLVTEADASGEFAVRNEPGGDQANAEFTAAIRKRLEIRFRKHEDNPIMQIMRSLAEKQLIQAKLSNPSK